MSIKYKYENCDILYKKIKNWKNWFFIQKAITKYESWYFIQNFKRIVGFEITLLYPGSLIALLELSSLSHCDLTSRFD